MYATPLAPQMWGNLTPLALPFFINYEHLDPKNEILKHFYQRMVFF